MNKYKVTVSDIVCGTDDFGATEAFCHSICHNVAGEVNIELLGTLEEGEE